MKLKKIKVAIDGPAGAGKSTVARLVAGTLGYIYVDTGAMYRAVTWYFINKGISTNDKGLMVASLPDIRLELKPATEGQQIWVNNREVTGMIRTPEVTAQVSSVAQVTEVRGYLTKIQKRLSTEGGIVMDGRDIGTEVLPDAELKIFLTASVDERAARRYKELLAAGTEIPLAQLKQDIMERDRMDQERALSPLREAEDAVFIDCTSSSIHTVVQQIVHLSLSIINEAKSE